jgi:hypothetical protein
MKEEEQLPLFDGDALKEQGMARVISNSLGWHEAALVELRRYLVSLPEINGDGFHRHWLKNGNPEPHHENAWGPLFSIAARRGWMRKTNKTTKCILLSSHSRELPIWRSLLYRV